MFKIIPEDGHFRLLHENGTATRRLFTVKIPAKYCNVPLVLRKHKNGYIFAVEMRRGDLCEVHIRNGWETSIYPGDLFCLAYWLQETKNRPLDRFILARVPEKKV